MRAFVDNMTHGAIGLLSWHIVTGHLGELSLSMRVCAVVLCGLMASAVDLDHFAAAKSLRIQVLQPYMLFVTQVFLHTLDSNGSTWRVSNFNVSVGP